MYRYSIELYYDTKYITSIEVDAYTEDDALDVMNQDDTVPDYDMFIINNIS